MSQHTVLIGSFVNPIALNQVDLVSNAYCSFNNSSGNIVEFTLIPDEDWLSSKLSTLSNDYLVEYLKEGQFVIPGFVDLHTHAPQYRNLGVGLDMPLLEWLDKVTFPEEAGYARQESESLADFQRRIGNIYGPMVKHYLDCGTTTCVYFGGLHGEANKELAKQVALKGQRALIGKTCMDWNTPSYYKETTEDSLRETTSFIEFISELDQSLPIPSTIYPVVTPRFALCCSRDGMSGLGSIARDHNCHVQTHMSENKDEIAYAAQLYPENSSYSDIYESHGLLHDKSIIAHCVHMNDEKMHCLARNKCAVAHCPNSNYSLNSGISNVRQLIEAGIKVGLGTDVSGGYSVSMLDAIRQALIASKTHHFTDPTNPPLTILEALYLATLGGAKAVSLDHLIGNFDTGKKFDAIIVDMQACRVPRPLNEPLSTQLQRFLFTGDDRWISKVYVNGQPVKN